MTFKEVWSYAAPFVAATIASGVTYFFARRGKRDDIRIAERLAAFRVLQERLLALARYCNAFAAEIDGGDLQPRIADLPLSNRSSALLHMHDIEGAIEQHLYLPSASAQRELDEVRAKLSLICSLNVMVSTEELHS